MTRSLLDKYQMGMITDEHLVVETLHMVDPDNPGVVLSSLPREILMRMQRFTTEYRAGHMVTNYGVLPTPDQVDSALHWIENAIQEKAATAT
jgi:hypothetical protein